MNEVSITPEKHLPATLSVYVGTVLVGCIINDINYPAYFRSYTPFGSITVNERDRVLTATREKVTLLNITRRLMS